MVASSTGERPNIFRYLDFREFLEEFFAYLKADKTKRFTVSKLSSELALSTGYISTVLAGGLTLPKTTGERIAKSIGLNASEQSYFELIRMISEADSTEDRLKAMKKLKRFREAQSNHPKEVEIYQYLSHWYFVAIRDMSTLDDFKLEPKWIQKRLKYSVSIKEIRRAIDFLKEHEFLVQNEEGKFVPASKRINCYHGVYRIALGKWHEDVLSLAAQSIEKTQRDERHLNAFSLAAAEEDLPEIKRILDEAKEKIYSLSEKRNKKTMLYNLHMAAYPVLNGDKENPHG